MSHVKRKLFSFFCSTRRDAKTCFTLSRSQVIILCFLLVIGTIFLALFSLNLFCSTATFQRSAQKILVFWREKNQISAQSEQRSNKKKLLSWYNYLPFFSMPAGEIFYNFPLHMKARREILFPKTSLGIQH